MGYVDPENLKMKHLPFHYAVWNLEVAKKLNQYQKRVKVHVFVDTGMHREGIILDELESFLKELKKLKNIEIIGMMSHFAGADEKNSPQTKLQVGNFQKALKICTKLNIAPKWKHLSNSVGLFSTSNTGCSLARVGKALYGIDPLGKNNPNIKPVLCFSTKLVQIKEIKKGDRVGYWGTFTAKKDLALGILPLGYNDGLDRRLSNKGIVLVRGAECPIIGMVSMNVAAIDLSKVKNPKIGEEVVVYSDKILDKNSIVNSAKLCSTIPYDIMVNLVSTTRRIVA